MNEQALLELIHKLDTKSSIEQAEYWAELKKIDFDVPKYFLLAYPTFKKWQGRVHLVFNCIKYARTSNHAFQLGVEALADKATLVRYRGAAILAYSLRKEAIPYLEKNLTHSDNETRQDAERAIRAIKKQNHHVFMEGRAEKWIVNREIDEENNRHKNQSFLKRIKNLLNK